MGSCWSDASNDVAADRSVSGKDAITEADVKVVSVGRSENLGGQPKLYTPSTLNIDFIQWHTQLIMNNS